MAILFGKGTIVGTATAFARFMDGRTETLYGGVQPSLDDFVANWNTVYKSGGTNPPLASTLVTSPSNSVTYNYTSQADATMAMVGVNATGYTDTRTALASGTITWMVMWYGGVTLTASAAVTTVPFLICPAGDSPGSCITFTPNTITQGQTFSINKRMFFIRLPGSV